MPEKYLLSLEQGTTSTRAILWTKEGREIASAAKPLAVSFPQAAWVEQSAIDIVNDGVAIGTIIVSYPKISIYNMLKRLSDAVDKM